MSFLVGYNKKVTWNPGPGPITLNVTEHTWSEWLNKLDVTHSGSGGICALLGSYLMGDGNVKANSDDGQVITNASINIRAGATGTVNFYHFALGANPFQVPCLIHKVNFKTIVSGVCSYDFDCSLNGLAGTYVLPS